MDDSIIMPTNTQTAHRPIGPVLLLPPLRTRLLLPGSRVPPPNKLYRSAASSLNSNHHTHLPTYDKGNQSRPSRRAKPLVVIIKKQRQPINNNNTYYANHHQHAWGKQEDHTYVCFSFLAASHPSSGGVERRVGSTSGIATRMDV